MIVEDFQEIELPVQENGKWIVYAAGSKTIRLLSDAKLHEDETSIQVLGDDGVHVYHMPPVNLTQNSMRPRVG